MTEEIKINKLNKSITFINNGIAYSQFGIADEILDLITNLQQENERLKEDNLLIKSANKLVSDNQHNYKSRCEKANEIITDFMCTEEYCNVDPVAIAENYMEIQKALNGSDENE